MFYAELFVRRGLFTHVAGWWNSARNNEKPGLDETKHSNLTFNQEIDALRHFTVAFNVFHECVEKIAIELGFKPAALSEELDTSAIGKLDEGVRQTFALWIENARTGQAIEIGQTEERRVYMQKLPKQNPPPGR